MVPQPKKATRRLGKQPPQYRFFYNPYRDVRFTRCPQCEQPTRQKKLPLVIHIDPMQLIAINKTCRYCPHCDLLIVHKDSIEQLLVTAFSDLEPETMENHYLIVGTMDKAIWKRGTQTPLTIEETLDALHDFREAVKFQVVGGWAPATGWGPQPLEDPKEK